MASNPSVWTDKTVNDFLVLTCTVLADSGLRDAYTLKTPADLLDGSKPFTLFVSAATTPDDADLPLHLWLGYGDDFLLSGDHTSLVAAEGGFYVQLTEDCNLALATKDHAFHIHPDLGVADVVTETALLTGYKVTVPPAPYYVFCLNGAGTLNAVTTTFRVIQKQGV